MSGEKFIIQHERWMLVPAFLRYGSRFAMMPRHLLHPSHQSIPLEVLGLMLCAGVEWAHANFAFLVEKEMQRGQSLNDMRALVRARAWREFPDMRPMKFL